MTTLTEQISRTLGLTVHRSVALIGVGNLGQALAGYAGFASRGFRIAALLDADPARIGSTIRGLEVRDIADLDEVVAEHAHHHRRARRARPPPRRTSATGSSRPASPAS